MNISIRLKKASLVIVSLLLLCFDKQVHAQVDIATDCVAVTSNMCTFEGSLITLGLSDDTRTLVVVENTGNSQELAAGYWRTSSFYSPFDQTLLIWVYSRSSHPLSDEPEDPVVELWSSDHTRLASSVLSGLYLPIQRLPDGDLIVFDIPQRAFLLLSTSEETFGTLEFIVNQDDLPDVRGVSQARFSYDEFAFSPNLEYVAYKQRGLNLAVYSLEQNQIVWVSGDVPKGMEPMSQPVWNSTSDTLAAALFVEDEMQLFLINPLTGEQTQLTDFPPDPRYGELAMIHPGSHLSGIIWSPNDRYVTFTQVYEGLNILDTETMIITNTCADLRPSFWSSQSNYLFVSGQVSENQVQVLDITTNRAYSIIPDDSVNEVLGWWWRPTEED